MTAPVRLPDAPLRAPQDSAFDLTPGQPATTTPVPMAPDRAALQQLLGNRTLLDIRGDPTGATATPDGSAKKGLPNPQKPGVAPGGAAPPTSPNAALPAITPPAVDAATPNAAPPAPVAVPAPANLLPAPATAVTAPPTLHAANDLPRQAARAADQLPHPDATAFSPAQQALRAAGFRMASTRSGGAPAAARGGGGGQRSADEAPREPDPVPAATKALVAVGEKTLADVPEYVFLETPGKHMPTMGRHPLSPSDAMILRQQGSPEFNTMLADVDARRLKDRGKREEQFNAAQAEKEATRKKKGLPAPKGPGATPQFEDDGPKTFGEMRLMLMGIPTADEIRAQARKKELEAAKDPAALRSPYFEPEPPPPITFAPAQKADITRVLAGLQADADGTATSILDDIRGGVVSKVVIGGVLQANAKEIGTEHLAEVKTLVGAQVEELRKGAEITAEELQTAIAARKDELARLRVEMAAGSTREAQDLKRATAEANAKEVARKTAPAAAAAARAEAVKKAAKKIVIPMDVESRRTRLLANVTTDVSDLVVRFKQKGEIRARAVTARYRDVADAYKFAAQQDEFANAQGKSLTEQMTAAFGEQQRAIDEWLKARLAEVEAAKADRNKADDGAITALQDEVRAAGDAKREAIRTWAEKKSGKKRSDEQRQADLVADKAEQEKSDKAALEKLQQTRLAAGVVNDFSVVQAIAAEVQAKHDRATIIANLQLNTMQQAMLDAYLQPPVPGDDRTLSAVMAGARKRIQMQLQEKVSTDIESQILGNPVYAANFDLLDRIGGVQTARFSAVDSAQKIHEALDKLDTDEATVFSRLGNLTPIQVAAVKLAYVQANGTTIEADLDGTVYGMSGNELKRAQALLASDQKKADAIGYRIALKGNDRWYSVFGSADPEELDKLNHGRPLEERQVAEDAYNAMYDKTLASKLAGVEDPKKKAEIIAEYRKSGSSQLADDAKEELRTERQKERFKYSMAGDDDTADAIALRDRLPTPGDVRTAEERQGSEGAPPAAVVVADRKKVEEIYDRIGREAAEKGAKEHWTSAQVEAEIARRAKKIEGIFNTKYAGDYEATSGSALRAAFDVGFRYEKPAADLANALADNQLDKADAARIQIEHNGVYAADDVENRVLTQQYQRALENTRRDEMPLRNIIMARQLADEEQAARNNARQQALASGQTKEQADLAAARAWNGNMQGAARDRLQREMNRAMERAAEEQAKGNMHALRTAYRDLYDGDLDAVVLSDTSGYDHDKAALLLKQNGRLTLGQTIFYAVRGTGTDEEALEALKGHTKAEIADARKEFRALALKDQWSARNLFNMAIAHEPHDTLDMDAEIRDDVSGRLGFDVSQWLKGEPETIEQRRQRMAEAVQWEKNSSPVGSLLAGRSESVMELQLRRMDETIAMLNDPTLTAAQRDLYLGYFEQDVTSVSAGIAAHREALDTWTDRITTAVGFVVGVAVTILTFGTAGLVMAAVLGSVLATASTIAIKAAILGAAYGWEDFYVDVAVGIVDALAAAATAGMGEKLMGAATGGVKAAAVKQSRFAVGRAVQKALLPGGRAAFLNPAEGALAKAIPTSALLEGMIKRGGMSKLLAVGLAEGAENIIANAPSALAGNILDDNNYKEGNPVGNILSGTMRQVGTSVGMGMAMKPVMKATSSVFEVMGRVYEAGKGMPGPKFESFEYMQRQHPDMTVSEYASLRAMHEAGEAVRERAVRESSSEAAEVREKTGDSAREAERGSASSEQRPVPDGPDAESARDLVTHRAMDEGRVRDLMPAEVREKLGVRVDPNQSPDAVYVKTVKRLGVVVAVELVVGPAARPMDVIRHAGTVHAMQRYLGITGSMVRAVEYARSWIVKHGVPPFGTKAWEAWHELHKLPAMLDDRFELLRTGALDAAAKERIFADIDRLASHIDRFRETLEVRDLSSGEGHIAAPGEKAPRAWGSRKIPRADRANPGHERFDAPHSALASRKEFAHAEFLQIDRSWREIEGGVLRTYRTLEVRDPVTKHVLMIREEIQSLNARGEPIAHWVQRGSEGNTTGFVGERAFENQFRADQLAGKRTGEILLHAGAIQRGGGQGFDGVIAHFDEKGIATLTLVEVKNYPGRYVPGADITAIRDNLNANLRHLEAMLGDVHDMKALGLTPVQAATLREAIGKNRLKFELQLGDTTKLGTFGEHGASVLRDLRADISQRRRFAFPQDSLSVARMDPEHIRAARELSDATTRLDTPKELQTLARGGETVLTAEGVRRAEATITAQRKLPGLAEPPLSVGATRGTFVDAKDRPFMVFAPERGTQGAGVGADLARALKDTRALPGAPTHIILDETNLSATDAIAARQELARIAADEPRLDLSRVVVVNVSTGTVGRLKPVTP